MEKYNLVKELILDRIGEKGIVNMIYDYILPLDNKELLMEECLDIIKEFYGMNRWKISTVNENSPKKYWNDFYNDNRSIDKYIISKGNEYIIDGGRYKAVPLQIFNNVIENIDDSKLYRKISRLLN